MIKEEKPPLPRTTGITMRLSGDRFNEEKKESKANLGNLGAQVITGHA